MKTIRLFTAGIGCAVALGTAGLAAATGAHAAPPKVLCIFGTVSGASGEISALKCKRPDNTGSLTPAVWSESDQLDAGNGDWIGSRSGERPTADGGWDDVWSFDPTMVGFGDLKKELMRVWGYTTVYVETSGVDGSDPSYLVANYDAPSKKKN